MDELYGQGAGARDGHDAADASSETDRLLRPVDENGQENWAEDAEPMTRSEYADQMRQGPAIEENDGPGDDDPDHDDAHVEAIAHDSQASEELPEPRTRQEVAAEADHADPASPDHDQAADTDIDAAIAEEDKLPEPRTRQEFADEARSGDPLVRGEPNAQAADLPERQPEKQAGHQEPVQREQHGQDRSEGDTRIAVVQANTADRTLGDTTPTGIGLKPTGEQLMKMENKEASKPEKLRRKFFEGIDDLNDTARENASLGHDLLTRHHPPAGHAVTEVPHPLPEAPHEGGAAPDITSAGLVAGVLLVEATRRGREPIHRIAEAAKGQWPWR